MCVQLHRVCFTALVAVTILFLPHVVDGQIIDFDGGGATDSWTDAANWVGDVQPSSTETAQLTSGDVVSVDSNVDVGNVQSTSASIDLALSLIHISEPTRPY